MISRSFSADDQRRFAELSGDANPIHIDPVFARRTQAGAPVVHGIQSLLWLLDVIGQLHPELPTTMELKVRFSRFIYVGDEIRAHIVEKNRAGLHAQIVGDGAVAVDLTMIFRPLAPAVMQLPSLSALPIALPKNPIELAMEEMDGREGRIAFVRPPEELAQLYPYAAKILGPRGPAALGCSSLLVGMIVPGLHSIYSSLIFTLNDGAETTDALTFKVLSVKPRFSIVRIEICGGGVAGRLEAFVRRPPARQLDVTALRARLSHDEFLGTDALVVGGSRGLGELTANMLAAGGARVTITYASGATDAERVASGIRASGGVCETAHFDVRGDADGQLARIGTLPTHVYYFASPAIFRQRSRLFEPALFDVFNDFYISGFDALVQACARRRPEGVIFFYPSTVAIEGPPSNLLEYAMSKGGGELLCAAISKQNPKLQIRVSRLPRLPTDQTASLLQVHAEDPVNTMLPLVRAMQGSSC